MLVSCLPVLTLGFGGALTHLLRSAHDTPDDTTTTDQTEALPIPDVPALPAGPPAAQRARAPRKPRRAPVPDVDELMPLGWQVAADLAEHGQALTRDTLAAGLRAAGHPAGNARVGALLARLKAEAPPDPADIPEPVPALADGGS
jgi:hypothetical protein